MAAAEVRAEGVKRWADTGEERVPVLRGCSLAAAGVFRQVKIDKYVCRISTPSC